MAHHVALWQTALQNEALEPGDRVGIMLRNCPQWVMFEQAALGLGLVVVPLYTNDRAENLGYIIEDADIQLVLIENKDHWDWPFSFFVWSLSWLWQGSSGKQLQGEHPR